MNLVHIDVNRIYTQTFGVSAALLEREGKFLLVKEAATRDKGKWNQPAGWIDVGENPVVAAAREVKEETGFDFQPSGLVGISSIVKEYPDELHHGIKLAFSGNITGGQLMEPNDEITELRWFSKEEISGFDERELRDPDIKRLVANYAAGKIYPLEIINHSLLILK